ncbi:MAG TPA: ABC transporter ATP-binding protein [Planctomycetota bacterium]|nr:ABC transporter ATP-binding protein [Planctomycetota bacterium]
MSDTQKKAAISVRGVALTYPNGIRAIDGVSLTIAHGEFLAIIGPNGSGKSSLLRAMTGLQNVDCGDIQLEDTALAELDSQERARRIALVPQSLDVLPGYSVEDFVLMGRYAHLSGWRLYTKQDREVAAECLRRVDAKGFLQRTMNEMSGGERQRVLIARALAQESRTILLDEPTSALDLKHQLIVYRLIHEMHRSAGRTIVVVTHDLNLASQFADRLVLMQDGRVVSDGLPGDVLRREVLEKVYGSDLAFGTFEQTLAGSARPWVLPWARP